MFHRIRKHLTPSTAIAFLALVFALTGGAFAATSHGGGSPRATAIVAKAKPRVKPGPRGPAGPKGATGATGAAGAAGPPGTTGPGGPAGAKGENGAVGAAGTAGATGPQGPQGEKGEKGLQGEPGEPASGGGYPKTLPAGETETGSFVANFEKTGATFTAISFPVKLPLEIGVGEVHYVTVEEWGKENGKTPPAACQGTGGKPTAEKGNLCVYEGRHSEGAAISELAVTGFVKAASEGSSPLGAGTTGALLRVAYEGTEEGVFLSGTWAVTAL